MKAIISRILFVSFLYSSVCLDIIAVQTEEYKTCEDVTTMRNNCIQGQESYDLEDESGIVETCMCPSSASDLCIFLAQNATNPSRCLTENDKFTLPWYSKDASGNIKPQTISVTCNCKTIKNDYCTNIQAITENCTEANTFTLGRTGITCNCPTSPLKTFQELGGVGGVAGLAAGLVAATGLIILLIVKLKQRALAQEMQNFKLSVKEQLLFKSLEKTYRTLSVKDQAAFLEKNKDLFTKTGVEQGRFVKYMAFDQVLFSLKQAETVGNLLAHKGTILNDLFRGNFKVNIPTIGTLDSKSLISTLSSAGDALKALDIKTDSASGVQVDVFEQVIKVVDWINNPTNEKLNTAVTILDAILKQLKSDPLIATADLLEVGAFLKDVKDVVQNRIKSGLITEPISDEPVNVDEVSSRAQAIKKEPGQTPTEPLEPVDEGGGADRDEQDGYDTDHPDFT